ncbi:MAG: hypothetical protein QUS09_08495, partial [Methanotrichaceae archaeon]|nr:hypothetical protein [Methanotrichaceae archaeon]
MERISAVIETAEIHKISDLFHKKPSGLRFNETDALVISARTKDGRDAKATFYFSLKPDGTFEENILGASSAKARRHKLASFLRYYKIAEDVSKYKFCLLYTS